MGLKSVEMVFVYRIERKGKSANSMIAETMRYLTNVDQLKGEWSDRVIQPSPT